jgi:penicillin-binding protein 2
MTPLALTLLVVSLVVGAALCAAGIYLRVPRMAMLRGALLLIFIIFLLRLAYWQLLQGDYWQQMSVYNHLRWVRSPAPRGLIVDRQGYPLATNKPALSVWLVSGEVPRDDWDTLLERLVAIGLFPDLKAARAQLEYCHRFPGYQPVRIGSRLTLEIVSRLEEELAFLPGVYLKIEPIRHYPGASTAAHIVGYLREINAEELAAHANAGYRLGDLFGKAGLEREFESELRGMEGGEQVEVDARGRVLRTLSTKPSVPGETITLTLDVAIQRAAEQGLHGHRGAAVVLDPANGDILALASAPAYDLNVLSGKVSRQMLAWLHGSQMPEINRATRGRYPPGSVFKIVTAAAALEAGEVQPNTYYYCDGVYHGIHCWKRSGHGALSLTEAIAHSCNVAFMKQAEAVGIARLSAMGRRFGFGATTGIDVLRESQGTVPDPEWAKAHGQHWRVGDTLQTGIGQSALEVTPLQSARLIAAIANGGKLVHPRLVRSVGDRQYPATEPELIGLKPETVRRITRGLRAVVGEGTARQLDPALRIAGKTGTAQNPGGEDHAWFVGYAPAHAPRVAVAVLVEHGGHGGAMAAPIVESIIRAALQPTNR